MALETQDIRAPLRHHRRVRPLRPVLPARGGEAHRPLPLHRLQGLPGRLHGVERPPRGGGYLPGDLPNPLNLTDQSWTVMRFNETEVDGSLAWLIFKDGCMHCADPGCLRACPAPGAIVQYANGIVDFQQDDCIGCGYCITGCPFDIPRIRKEDGRVYKCTLCSDRVAVGLEPACIKSCPTQALTFGSKAEMKELAAHRLVDLRERGLSKAAIYDPPGVGGTHVFFVLPHGDRPETYGLPRDPSVGPVVTFWRSGMPACWASPPCSACSWPACSTTCDTGRSRCRTRRTGSRERRRSHEARRGRDPPRRQDRPSRQLRAHRPLAHRHRLPVPLLLRAGALLPLLLLDVGDLRRRASSCACFTPSPGCSWCCSSTRTRGGSGRTTSGRRPTRSGWSTRSPT